MKGSSGQTKNSLHGLYSNKPKDDSPEKENYVANTIINFDNPCEQNLRSKNSRPTIAVSPNTFSENSTVLNVKDTVQ